MKLDDTFRASTRLYDCNPRAIYEGPIKEFLIEHEIPHRKSGPLNVAKATVGLDITWATQRRPSAVAKEVVHLVNYIEEDNTRINSVAISLLRRLINESKRMESINIDIEPSFDPVFLNKLCFELITKVPDSGNTPQKISALLLKNYHIAMNTGIIVTGEEDRASVTSTTSKKPGDVNEEAPDGTIYKVYEITVKTFDLARIRDSYDCIHIYNENTENDILEIIVICRPEDCPTEMYKSNLHLFMGHFKYQDIVYYYWNIYEWMADTLQRMIPQARASFYKDLNTYISHINTAESVKLKWQALHNN
ncbi:hypothetical protein AN643_04440 [Candidatus Epulonipiscioides saccharophilum]|nr:hypothetical protein AN643_04440 [Epulopiscium sp. SCG-B10WGA-EpuloB]